MLLDKYTLLNARACQMMIGLLLARDGHDMWRRLPPEVCDTKVYIHIQTKVSMLSEIMKLLEQTVLRK